MAVSNFLSVYLNIRKKKKCTNMPNSIAKATQNKRNQGLLSSKIGTNSKAGRRKWCKEIK